jgi:hypothetical protein
MGMGEQHDVDVGGMEREGAVVERLQRFGALEQPAIDQHACLRRLEQIAGAGHCPRCATKFDRDAHVVAAPFVGRIDRSMR